MGKKALKIVIQLKVDILLHFLKIADVFVKQLQKARL